MSAAEDTGAPNLDAMPREELAEWARKYNADPVAMAREVFPTRPRGYVRASQTLAVYAERKALAMSFRERGLITNALHEESQCERIYDSLPAFARW